MRARLCLSFITALLAGCGSSPRRPPADAALDAHVHPGHDASVPTDLAGADLAPPTPLPPETMAIAGALHGAFLELPCAGPELEFQFCVPADMGQRSLSLKFGGQPGTTYAVVLSVWGVMETIKFQGGTLAGDAFYIGGASGTPDTADYGLEVGAQSYHFNYRDLGAGEHYTYGIQYDTPPIPIPGGATLTLYVRSPDDLINTNHMDSTVTDPPPRLQDELARIMMEPVQGQFIYLEVKSAVAQ